MLFRFKFLYLYLRRGFKFIRPFGINKFYLTFTILLFQKIPKIKNIMQRFNKDMVAAFTRLTSKKRIPPKPAKPIVKKTINPAGEKGSNENLYMIGASMFYFAGTVVQIELQNKLISGGQVQLKFFEDSKMAKTRETEK